MLKRALLLLGIASMVACGGSAGSSDGDTSVGSSEGALLAGTHLTASEVATYVRDAGFPESEVGKMVCIAKYESSFYEKAEHHNTNGSTDYGLFQINSVNLGSHGCAASGSAAYDPTTNAHCAKVIYGEQGANAWYAYKSHRSECDSYAAPSSSSSSSAVKGTSTTSGSSTTTSGSSSTSGTSGSMSGTTTTTGSSGGTATSTGSTTGTNGTTTTTGTTTTSGDDTTGDDDSSGDDSGTTSSDPPAGSCWSQTLGQSIAPDGCVQSAYDGVEEQCINGSWFSGVSNGIGPDGKCTSEQ
jgi:hypothetical protein